MIRPVFDLGVSVIAALLLLRRLFCRGSNCARGPTVATWDRPWLPKGLPPQELLHFIFQGFDGLPLLHSQWFGVSAYEITCAYVGVTVLVLAALALVQRWRRPEVRSIVLAAVPMGLLVFVPPLVSFLDTSVYPDLLDFRF